MFHRAIKTTMIATGAVCLLAANPFASTAALAKKPPEASSSQTGGLQEDVRSLQSFIRKLPDGSFTKPAHARRRALDHKLDVVARQVGKSHFGGAIAKLDNDIRSKMDGCLGGVEANDWISDCPAQRELDPRLTDLVGKLLVQYRPVFGACEQEQALGSMLQEHLGDTLRQFDLRKIRAERFRNRVSRGQPIDLPVVDEQGQLHTVLVSAERGALLAGGVKLGRLKGQDIAGEPLGPDTSWRLGCTESAGACGGVTFLDEQFTQVEGLVTDFESGVSFIESADNLLSRLQGQRVSIEPGCSLVYNADHHSRIPFELDGMDPDLNQNLVDKAAPAARDKAAISYTIPIVLDADASFYSLDPDTVWRRQRSILWGANLIYSLIEPLSAGAFDIRFEIKGQESWRPGFGPTTTDNNELTQAINAPDYFMYTHPDRNELSYLFLGYDMDGGIGGQAGGLCGVDGTDRRTGLPWDRTFASDLEHQWTHAWGQQVPDVPEGDRDPYEFATAYGRIIVMAHELGHMLGALHSKGDQGSDVCAGDTGGWSRMCGTSLMMSGAAGGVAPDFRKPFFSDENDDAIVDCVGRVAIF